MKATESGTAFHFVEEVEMPFGIIGKLLGIIGQGTADKMVAKMLIKLKNLSESEPWKNLFSLTHILTW